MSHIKLYSASKPCNYNEIIDDGKLELINLDPRARLAYPAGSRAHSFRKCLSPARKYARERSRREAKGLACDLRGRTNGKKKRSGSNLRITRDDPDDFHVRVN